MINTQFGYITHFSTITSSTLTPKPWIIFIPVNIEEYHYIFSTLHSHIVNHTLYNYHLKCHHFYTHKRPPYFYFPIYLTISGFYFMSRDQLDHHTTVCCLLWFITPYGAFILQSSQDRLFFSSKHSIDIPVPAILMFSGLSCRFNTTGCYQQLHFHLCWFYLLVM